MIQGGSGVVSCDCENLEFFLEFVFGLKNNIYIYIYIYIYITLEQYSTSLFL